MVKPSVFMTARSGSQEIHSHEVGEYRTQRFSVWRPVHWTGFGESLVGLHLVGGMRDEMVVGDICPGEWVDAFAGSVINQQKGSVG